MATAAAIGRAASPRIALAAAAAAGLLAAGGCDRPHPLPRATPECERCHGGGGSAAPPASALGYRATTDLAVGAHRRHLEAHPGAVRSPIACDECHVVPTRRDDGHIDGAHATISFGALAGADLAAPAWDRAAATCAGTYCHGATLGAGGTNPAPVWTAVDEGQAACGACHGAPPPFPHPSSPACERCHPDTVLAGGGIDLAGGQHVDGDVDVAPLGCASCHGSAENAAPPASTAGESDPSAIAVGAHQAHLRTGAIRLALPCESCHPVPTEPRHADGAVDLAWSALAGSVAWDRDAATCATYCHGATLGAGGANTLPVWTAVGTGQTACGTCHGNPPPLPHPQRAECGSCHPDTVADGAIDVAGGQHVDGEVDVGPLGCSSCHGSAGNAAPPVSTAGASDTTAIGVGAHQAHLRDGAIRLAVGCTSCHAVPSSNLHADGTVDLAWSALAGSVTWDRASATCSTYCHGAMLGAGGTNTLPVWTSVGTGQTACGTCHGFPPPAPHPAISACASCHPGTMSGAAIDVAGGLHIDGTVEADVDCGGCHGAPPATGAHLAHAPFADPSLVAYGDQRILEDYSPAGGPTYLFGCGNCHPLDSARHMDATVQVDLSPAAAGATGLRARNDAAAAYAAGTCGGTYCHSSGQEAPTYAASPEWTAAPGALGCDGCHGNPPRYPSGGAGAPNANSHVNLADDGYEFGHFLGVPGVWHTTSHGSPGAAPITCQTCHFDTVDPANTAPGGFYYLDTTGAYELPGGDPARIDWGWTDQLHCTTCHTGSAGAPPQGTGRALPLRHVNGVRDVVFDPRTALPPVPGLPAPPDTPSAPYWVASANPSVPWPATVTWNGATVSFDVAGVVYVPETKTCSGVACHLAQPAAVWGAPYGWGPGGENCNLCHPF